MDLAFGDVVVVDDPSFGRRGEIAAALVGLGLDLVAMISIRKAQGHHRIPRTWTYYHHHSVDNRSSFDETNLGTV